MRETYHTCPKCENEILFEVEYDSADDFAGYNAGICAPEFQKDCKCEFTDKELEEMEKEVADNYVNSFNDYE